jgi:hypothetical protein
MKHQVSNPYKTAGKILVLYILIFTIFKRKLDDKILDLMVAGIS